MFNMNALSERRRFYLEHVLQIYRKDFWKLKQSRKTYWLTCKERINATTYHHFTSFTTIIQDNLR